MSEARNGRLPARAQLNHRWLQRTAPAFGSTQPA